MRWEEMTVPEFTAARDTTGVCLLGVGCLERHGDHLPLGTDYLNVHALCCRAAALEPAVVFPPYYFGQIMEARCFPGTVALGPDLLLQLFLAVLDEIGRNGFGKILVVNGHGGNTGFLQYVLSAAQYERKDYLLYLFDLDRYLQPRQREELAELLDVPEGGHAGEDETSVTMANHPDLVKLEQVPPPAQGRPNPRLEAVTRVTSRTTFSWYSMYPEHYAGDARKATARKGERIVAWSAANLAAAIRAVKEDAVSPELRTEFFAREAELRAASGARGPERAPGARKQRP